jgi:tRNA pseudouridine55 synthase
VDLILNINKEKSISSFDVIRFLRRKTGERRMGFQGTLDVFAEGVLPVFTGSYTKIIPYIYSGVKDYLFEIQLGLKTDTLDITGNITEKKDFPKNLQKEELEILIRKNFTDGYIQRVPEYSAVKINGAVAYKLARKGISQDMPSKEVKIFDVKILSSDGGIITGKISVSSGFYVRQFANDLGESLKTYAIVTKLQRTKSGDFSIEESIKMDEADEKRAVNLKKLLEKRMKIIYMNEEMTKDLRNGKEIPNTSNIQGLCVAFDSDERDCIILSGEGEALKVKRIIK